MWFFLLIMALILCMGNMVHFLQNVLTGCKEAVRHFCKFTSLSSLPVCLPLPPILPPSLHPHSKNPPLIQRPTHRRSAPKQLLSRQYMLTPEQKAKRVGVLDKCSRYVYKYISRNTYLEDLQYMYKISCRFQPYPVP